MFHSMSDDRILIHTRVPKALGEWVKRQAQKEGLSMASWLRRLVMKDRERAGGGK
jgi:hypothetical protein